MYNIFTLNLIRDSESITGIITKGPVGGKAKRCFDILFSVAALLSLSVVFLIIIVIIKLSSEGPALFSHHRVGRGGKTFPCLKFRTMVLDADDRLRLILESNETARQEFAEYRKLKNDPRVIPKIGHFLRATSLDELPQLINVLLGHMSIVGPRPVTEGEIGEYGESVAYYLSSRPGMTGLWQISGRNNLAFSDRVRFDRIYISHWSFVQDLLIILRTVDVVIFRRGAY